MKRKICSKCGIEKELCIENFETRKNSKDGFRGVCRECRNRIYVGKGSIKILDKTPELEKYLCNKDDGYSYSYGSNKRIKVKCPICGFCKEMKVNDFVRFGFGCNVCSDGISFGEKIVSSILNQFNVSYKRENIFDWDKNHRYDFYLTDINTIIEVHGKQHYEESTRGRSLEEEQKNDKLKEFISLKNGIKNYIVVDCRKSEFEYIMNSIISNGKISNILNIGDINWKHVLNNSQHEIMDEVIRLYNTSKNITYISNKLQLGREVVRDYLKLANDLNLVEYSCKDRTNDKKDEDFILSQYNIGFTIQQISEDLMCHEDTVRKIIKRMSNIGLCEYDGEFNKKNSKNKAVFNVLEKMEYKSITEASKITGIPNTTLRRYCNNINNKEWVFADNI